VPSGSALLWDMQMIPTLAPHPPPPRGALSSVRARPLSCRDCVAHAAESATTTTPAASSAASSSGDAAAEQVCLTTWRLGVRG